VLPVNYLQMHRNNLFSRSVPTQPWMSTRQGKREQISRLLINKFRQKYNVDFDSDCRLDAKIVDCVQGAVKSDEALGEKQLVQLSRKVAATVEDYRKRQRNGTLSETTIRSQKLNNFFANDKKSQEGGSRASTKILSSGSHSVRNNLRQKAIQEEQKRQEQEELGKLVMAMTMNKGTGMSDAEWNEIVRQRIEKEKLEDTAAKEKRERQRETIKEELAKQI